MMRSWKDVLMFSLAFVGVSALAHTFLPTNTHTGVIMFIGWVTGNVSVNFMEKVR